MEYETVIGYSEQLVVFKIKENLYAVVATDGDVKYHSNWIYLLRWVQIHKGEPDEERLAQAEKFLKADKTDVGSLDIEPLDGKLKEAQDALEEELEAYEP